jgi:hypothetical protein
MDTNQNQMPGEHLWTIFPVWPDNKLSSFGEIPFLKMHLVELELEHYVITRPHDWWSTRFCIQQFYLGEIHYETTDHRRSGRGGNSGGTGQKAQ